MNWHWPYLLLCICDNYFLVVYEHLICMFWVSMDVRVIYEAIFFLTTLDLVVYDNIDLGV
jgi:hypothetical protein